MFAKRRNQVEKYYRKKFLPSLEIIENAIEFVIFLWRWVLAPAYVALGFCLALLIIKTVEHALELRHGFMDLGESIAIVKILGIVDMILVANLILMVLFVGYVNFVSKIKLDGEDDRPSWMDSLDYSGLKIQLLGSIVAISSVQLLRQYMDMGEKGQFDSERMFWMVTIHVTFVVSILLFAIVNWLHHGIKGRDDERVNEADSAVDENLENEEIDELPILVAAIKRGPNPTLILNRGWANKKNSDKLEKDQEHILSSTGESIIDPASGDVIGWQEEELGTVKLTHVLERSSIAVPTGALLEVMQSTDKSKDKVAVGDVVRPV